MLDHVDSPRPCYAEHPPAGQERPGGIAGAHEERAGADKDPEADGGGSDPHGPVKEMKSIELMGVMTHCCNWELTMNGMQAIVLR